MRASCAGAQYLYMYRILMLEDSSSDAELIDRKLRESGMEFTGQLVSSKTGFLDALQDQEEPPDIILADYTLPSFMGTEALVLAKEHCPETPFIFVTGTMGEETAVDALKSGAVDYILKDRLFLLPDVVSRALAEAQERRQLKITQERERDTEQELVVANRAKDDFLALLSHELRNPLVPLLVNAELIAGGAKDPIIQAHAQAIYRQAQHMAKLLDDLLDINRITRDQIILKKQEVNLEEIINDAINMVRPLADLRGHTITADIAPLRLIADPVRLEQIAVNLLNNAIKYTDDGGHVEISARRAGDSAIITVRDTGIGISADLLPRIFELFVRGDQSIARTSYGLGVGLTLVQRLVELHGGTVIAESEGLGKGSTFTVLIPIGISEDEDHVTTSSSGRSDLPEKQTTAMRKKVLVVDDNHDLTNVLGTALRAFGHSVRVAYDGREAIQIAQEMHPQVVLLDIGLPGMDGLAVARELREKFGREMELVALSGYGQEQDKQKAYEAGFDRYVVKPIGLKELKAIVEH